MEKTKELECCVVECEVPLDGKYWNNQYVSQTTGWDLGLVSPPLKAYFDTIENKNSSILIPGCGNAYEAEYLLSSGFTNISLIDIAPALVENLQLKFKDNSNIQILCGDFFELKTTFDLIVEQTFFCALPPKMRQHYVAKMHQLLNTGGKLIGLLFDKTFEKSPPFGGSKAEYNDLFQHAFHIQMMELTPLSITPRANTELFFEFVKNNEVLVNLYQFEGITCSGCKNTITEKYAHVEGILQASFSTDNKEVLMVSNHPIELSILRELVAYDENYKIEQL